MLPGICNQTSRIRKCSERFGIKGKKREPISSLMILTGFLICGRSNALRSARTNALSWQSFCQGCQKVSPLVYRYTLPTNDNIQGFYLGDIAGQASPNTKLNCTREEKWRYSSTALRKPDCQRKPAFYSVDQFPAFHKCNGFFTPFNRVARVMAQALERLANSTPKSRRKASMVMQSLTQCQVGRDTLPARQQVQLAAVG